MVFGALLSAQDGVQIESSWDRAYEGYLALSASTHHYRMLKKWANAQRNVLNERGRLQPEGTQEGASIPLLFSTSTVFVLRLVTPWVCVFPVFPTNKKNEPQFVLQTQKCWLYSDTLFE